jgi:hypothetical protein
VPGRGRARIGAEGQAGLAASRSANAFTARSASRPTPFSARSAPTCKSRTGWSSSRMTICPTYCSASNCKRSTASASASSYACTAPASSPSPSSGRPPRSGCAGSGGRQQRLATPPDAARRRYPAALLPLRQKHEPSARTRAGIAHQRRRCEFCASVDQGRRALAGAAIILVPSRPAPASPGPSKPSMSPRR